MSDGAGDSRYPGADDALVWEAEGHFRAAMVLAPRTPEAMLMLARAAHQAGLHAVARELLGDVFAGSAGSCGCALDIGEAAKG